MVLKQARQSTSYRVILKSAAAAAGLEPFFTRAVVPGARDFRLRRRSLLATVSTLITGAAGLKLAPARRDAARRSGQSRWSHRLGIRIKPTRANTCPSPFHTRRHSSAPMRLESLSVVMLRDLQAVVAPGQRTGRCSYGSYPDLMTRTPGGDSCITPSVTLWEVGAVSYIMTSDETRAPEQ